MKKILLSVMIGAVALLGGTTTAIAAWPEKTIRIIVPWGAGGATDQVTRVIASEMHKALGQNVIVVNQPGASGSVGSKTAWDAPHDGYTWTAGAAKDLGTYAVTGKMDTSIKDWHLYLNSALVSVISVSKNSPIKNIDDFIVALQKGSVKVGTSGVNSAGHSAIESVASEVGGSYTHAGYDGGAQAVLSTVSGETDATTQLISEQVDMLRAGKLRAIAVLSDADADVPGIGTIPSINQALPDLVTAPIYFGVFVPKNVPAQVIDMLNKIWQQKISTSRALAEYTVGRGSIMTVYSGAQAQAKVWPSIQINAWLLHDSGRSQVSPDTVGIPRP